MMSELPEWLCGRKEEFGDCLNEIKENRKVSEQHTFVSKIVYKGNRNIV